MANKLSTYQLAILERLRSGEVLSHGDYGHCTPAARFWSGKREGVNYRALDALQKIGLVVSTEGRFEGSFTTTTFYHVPGDKPWGRTPAHVGKFTPYTTHTKEGVTNHD